MSDRRLTVTFRVEVVYDVEWKDFSPLSFINDFLKKQVSEGNFTITNVEDEEVEQEDVDEWLRHN